ncbi:MAG: cell wall anchor protein [Oscillospiraceae bacterium]|jgi:hypothetical protein|nr:cell wall anchor protein [Oscillospiraceae bacterium]
MKRIAAIFLIVCVAASLAAPLFALAAESETPPAVSPPPAVAITVVMPDNTAPAAPKLYPVSVDTVQIDGTRRIVKTYELDADESPEDISREPFDRGGWQYILTDVTKTETAVAAAREHTETVAAVSASKDAAEVLALLTPTMAYSSADGYAGTLTLDISSVKVETAGTKTSGYSVNVTREYPNLSANDTSLIPKTVTENGRTLTLESVDWQAGNTVTVDYDALPEYYTAYAAYTGTASKTVVTGYIVTAEYSGTVAKLNPGKTVYTAYFDGAELVPEAIPFVTADGANAEMPAPTAEPVEEAAQTPETAKAPARAVWFVLFPLLGAASGCAYYFIKKKRKRNTKK